MGWNTWCTDDVCGLRDKCDEALIRSVADAMAAQGLHKLGYEYVNMDDCWSDTARNASGSLQPDPERFPGGMRALADYVHAKGLKIGVYICVGTQTCRGGRPGSYGYYEQDARTLAEWGIDFVKADNCHHPPNSDTRSMYFNLSAALNSTGHPFLFSLCEWGDADVQSWGADAGQMYRIQMDHMPLWHLPTKAAGEGVGQGVIDIARYVAGLQPSSFVRQFGWMDPDFLETLFPVTMSRHDSRTEFALWCMWSAPLIVATDIRAVSKEKADIIFNDELIAIDQDASNTAADAIYVDSSAMLFTWARPLANGDKAVAFTNAHDLESVQFKVTWDQLGWPAGASVKVRDLWEHADVGVFGANGFTARVHPHDTLVFRLTLQQDGDSGARLIAQQH